VPEVLDLTAATFDETVGASPVPLVVEFWAEWCGPCHALAPILDELATEGAGRLAIAKVDADTWPELALRFDVMSLPTLLVFDRGQVVRRLVGARPKRHLAAELDLVTL
jgi:thioredoxin